MGGHRQGYRNCAGRGGGALIAPPAPVSSAAQRIERLDAQCLRLPALSYAQASGLCTESQCCLKIP